MKLPAALVLAVIAGCGRIDFDPLSSPDAAARSECPADPRLVACYDFEGDTSDRSGHGNDAGGAQVTYVPGITGSAIEMTSASRVDLIAPQLDLTEYTLETWVRPEPFATGEGFIMDHNARWAVTLHAVSATTFELNCYGTPGPAIATFALAAGEWVHIACTHDATSVQSYVRGSLGAMVASGPIDPGSTAAAIGGDAPANDTFNPYAGAMDRFRIWRVARTPAELGAEASAF